MEAGISGKPASKQQKHHFSSISQPWQLDGAYLHLVPDLIEPRCICPALLTHPTPAGSTTWDAASQQTRPPRWACADRSPRTASRSSCSQRGKDEWTSTLYSSSWDKGQDGIAWLGIGSPRELAVNGRSPHVSVNNLTVYTLLTEAANITALILHFFLRFKQILVCCCQKLTGFLCTISWFFATAVSQMMVMTEFRTNEKKRFLCRVILWQLKLLREGKDIAITRASRSAPGLIVCSEAREDRAGWLTWSGKIFQGRRRGRWVTARVRLEPNKRDSWRSAGKTRLPSLEVTNHLR